MFFILLKPKNVDSNRDIISEKYFYMSVAIQGVVHFSVKLEVCHLGLCHTGICHLGSDGLNFHCVCGMYTSKHSQNLAKKVIKNLKKWRAELLKK